MNDRHLDSADLIGFVTGELGTRQSAALERHVARCTRCAERLRRAALVETALHEAAAAVPRRRVRRSWLGTVSAPMALTASLVLGLGLPHRWLGVGEHARSVIRGPATELVSGGACADDIGIGLCTDPTIGDGALALMSMPGASADDPFGSDDVLLCEAAADGSDLRCIGEPVDG